VVSAENAEQSKQPGGAPGGVRAEEGRAWFKRGVFRLFETRATSPRTPRASADATHPGAIESPQALLNRSSASGKICGALHESDVNRRGREIRLLLLAEQDMRLTAEAADALRERADRLLETAMVVVYCRPFSAAPKEGREPSLQRAIPRTESRPARADQVPGARAGRGVQEGASATAERTPRRGGAARHPLEHSPATSSPFVVRDGRLVLLGKPGTETARTTYLGMKVSRKISADWTPPKDGQIW
jgi:hypothetical protein